MLTKNDLRKYAKETRKSIDMMDISAKICEEIENSKIFKYSENIMIFYPLPHEVDLTSILTTKDKNFYLPRVNGQELDVCSYKLGDELKLSEYKTFEPTTKAITNLEILDIIFIPALMVDLQNYRLGYGGGFYDRLLSQLSPSVKKVAVIPKKLIAKELPHESFDIKVDFKICENGIYS